MAAKKYLKNNAGTITEESAVTTSAGAADDGKIPALNASGILDSTIVNSKTSSAGVGDSGKLVALDGTGRIDNSMMPVGIGADVAIITADTGGVSAGDFVNIYNNSGAKVRKADATTTGKEAHGFVLAGATSGNPATVYFEGTNTGVTGQTPGVVYLSTTAGLATSTPPSGAGNVVQRIGFALSATSINFQSQPPVALV